MIYLYISDIAVEVLQTKKGMVGGKEKITAASRKMLEEASVEKGQVKNESAVLSAISEALKTAYPVEIKDNKVAAILSDNQAIIKRLTVSGDKDKSDNVIEQAKKILPADISQFENFYRDIPDTSSENVLYTAVPVSTILTFDSLFKKANLTLSYLSTAGFAVYALLKPLTEKDKLVSYVTYEKYIHLYLLDKNGPLFTIQKKATAKNYASDLKALLKKVKTEFGMTPNRLVIAGEKSLEANITELEKELELPITKIGVYLDEYLTKNQMELNTGGVPSLYFDKVLGLLNLTSVKDAPNFASDLKNLRDAKVETLSADILAASPDSKSHQEEGEEEEEEEVKTTAEEEEPAEEKEKTKEEEKKQEEEKPAVKMETVEQEKSSAYSPEPLISDHITEYKKRGLGGILHYRYLLVTLVIAVFLILMGSFIIIGKSANLNLPFISSPTPTPTMTPVPTLTPTPTVNPDLKREDVTVSVLNGTDKNGLAKQTADSLEELGYKNINIGNADRDDYASTVIRIKDDAKDYLPLIKSDLKDTFDTATVETLPTDSKYDVVIVLGQK